MIWHHIKHFTKNENWGDPDRVNGLLLLLLDALRSKWGAPFIIHCACEQSGHSAGGQHPLGNAVDFHIEDGEPCALQIGVMEHFIKGLNVADRVGLGIYPDWRNPGFHLDVRGAKARWGRIGDEYVSFAEAKAYARDESPRPSGKESPRPSGKERED
jgi:hypothetical protein